MLWVRKRTVSMRRFFWAPQVRACNWKLFILYLNQNIYCKEPPQWDDSFENHWYERVTENDLSSISMKTYVVGSQYSLLILFQSRLNETVLLSNQKHTAAGPQIRACSSWRLFILFLNHNIYCGYSKRPPQWDGQWDGSFERPQNTHFYWWIKYNCNFTLLAAIMAHVRSRVRVFAPKKWARLFLRFQWRLWLLQTSSYKKAMGHVEWGFSPTPANKPFLWWTVRFRLCKWTTENAMLERKSNLWSLSVRIADV